MTSVTIGVFCIGLLGGVTALGPRLLALGFAEIVITGLTIAAKPRAHSTQECQAIRHQSASRKYIKT